MMKNGKKYHLKNDKAEHVLLYHFLSDENHAQVVSPRKNEWKQLLLYLYMCILVYTIYVYYISPSKNLIKVLWCHA